MTFKYVHPSTNGMLIMLFVTLSHCSLLEKLFARWRWRWQNCKCLRKKADECGRLDANEQHESTNSSEFWIRREMPLIRWFFGCVAFHIVGRIHAPHIRMTWCPHDFDFAVDQQWIVLTVHIAHPMDIDWLEAPLSIIITIASQRWFRRRALGHHQCASSPSPQHIRTTATNPPTSTAVEKSRRRESFSFHCSASMSPILLLINETAE